MAIAYNLANVLNAKHLAKNIGDGVVQTSDDALFMLRQNEKGIVMDLVPPGTNYTVPLFTNATAEEIEEYFRTKK